MKQSPIFIIGAPRSGTSLLQKLLRECPGHASVPREAQHIWGPHVHPSLSGWSGEAAPESALDDAALIASIRDAFRQSAVPAATWRRMESGAIGANKWLRRIARLFPRQAVEALIRSGRTSEDVRLVEKSVHAGLWLPLVDAVFPDARYVHIVRDPGKSIPSIMTGWHEPGRFAAFEVPDRLDIDGLDGATNDWCFPLPTGWRDYRNASLQDVATFQWAAVNEAILGFFEHTDRTDRCLQVRLEDLVAKPGESLRSIRRHADIADQEYFEAFENSLPVINKGRKSAVSVAVDRERLRERVASTAARLGYTPD